MLESAGSGDNAGETYHADPYEENRDTRSAALINTCYRKVGEDIVSERMIDHTNFRHRLLGAA